MKREEIIALASERFGDKAEEVTRLFCELRISLSKLLPQYFHSTSIAHMNIDQAELWCAKAFVDSIRGEIK